MNLLCHVRVALACDDDDLVVLGSILPDLEPLVGQVLDEAREDKRIQRGIALHRRTDAVFHADPRFIAGSIALSRSLQAGGVGRGASRAVGHAGWELLLDGLLVGDEAVTGAFAAANEALITLLPVDGDGADRLRGLAERQRSSPIWTGYDDPAVVADRLHRQLARRPRLAFPRSQLDDVIDGLEGAVPHLTEVGPALIDDVCRTVAVPHDVPG